LNLAAFFGAPQQAAAISSDLIQIKCVAMNAMAQAR
jgi:hypothetical protein